MKTIHKYKIDVGDSVRVQMPSGARVLDVQLQGPQLVLWALVYDDVPMVAHNFAWRGTGHNCEGMRIDSHVGTLQFNGLVFHLFYLGQA